jgi:hypothetical protein
MDSDKGRKGGREDERKEKLEILSYTDCKREN